MCIGIQPVKCKKCVLLQLKFMLNEIEKHSLPQINCLQGAIRSTSQCTMGSQLWLSGTDQSPIQWLHTKITISQVINDNALGYYF